MRTDDVNGRREMALGSTANGNEGETSADDASGSVFLQSAIDHGGEHNNRGSYVNCGFVHDTVVDIARGRISDSAVPVRQRDIPSADLCFSRRYIGPRVPLVREGIARIYRPRRLWFERRHWGSDAPECSVRVQFPRRVELGQGTTSPCSSPKESPDDSSSKVVYNIGVFYSDTDLCSGSSASEEGDDKSSEIINDRESSEKTNDRQSPEKTGDETPEDKPFASIIADTPDDLLREGSSAPAGKTYENVRGPRLLPAHKQVVVRSAMTGPSGGADPPVRRSSNRSRRLAAAPPNTQLTPDTITPDTPDNVNPQLPDILNSHLPPPYSTLPPTTSSNGRRLPPPSHPPPPPPPPPPPQAGAQGGCPARGRTSRGAGAAAAGGRRGRRMGAPSSFHPPPAASESDEPKHCCGVMVTQTVSIRWFIVMIAFVGLCCAVVGTVLGALKATGREHLTVSLLMIGVGIVLITVSGIAWRLTSHDAPSCRAMLGLQNSEHEPNRRFVPRVPPYGRPTHHPYAAMMYPEFQYRPPPPSYQASMQEYRLRLLLLDRHSTSATSPTSALSPVSPPPTYRSSHNATTATTPHSRPPLTLTEREYSRPPSYRSRASSAGVLRPSTETLCSLTPPATTQQLQQPLQQPTSHSRNPSLSLSFLSHESLFLDSGHSRPQPPAQHASFTSPSGDSVVGGLSEGGSSPPSWGRCPQWKHRNDVNAVTIVQTTDSSQVLNRDSVILSVPGNDVHAAGEVRILAHV